MFIGEGPGAEEDRQGLPFVGRSGKLLDRLMWEELGTTREHAYIANIVKCRPPENRDPKPDEIDACRPYLTQQLDLIRPAVVIALGRFAAQWLLQTTEGIMRLRGRSYPFAHGVLVPRCTRRRRCGAGRRRSARCGPTSCGPSWRWPAAGGAADDGAPAHDVVGGDEGAGGGGGRPRPPRRPAAAGRRPRRRQDDVRAGLRPGPRASRNRSPAPRSRWRARTLAACACTTSTCTGWSGWPRWATSPSASSSTRTASR